MKGLVSFSLFGDDPNDCYYSGAIKNAERYHQIWPEWDLWFFVGRSVPDYVLSQIKALNPNVSFEFVDEPEDQTSTWWRFRAIKHSEHDFILFRDVDSRPILREVMAVEEWIESDPKQFPYHVMRDHQYHGRVILAGLWGLKRQAFYNHRAIPDRIDGDYYGTDQIALQALVWPVCKRVVMAHIGCYQIFEKMDQRRPFTVRRSEKEPFVAQGLDAKDNPRYPGHEQFVDSDLELRRRNDVFQEKYRVQGEMPAFVDRRAPKRNLFQPVADE